MTCFPDIKPFSQELYFTGDKMTLVFESNNDYSAQLFRYSTRRLKSFYNKVLHKVLVSSSPISNHLTVKHKLTENRFQFIVSILFSRTICTRIRRNLHVFEIQPLIYEGKDFNTILTYSLMLVKDKYGMSNDNYRSSSSILLWQSLCIPLYAKISFECFLDELLTPHVKSRKKARLIIREILDFTKKSKD